MYQQYYDYSHYYNAYPSSSTDINPSEVADAQAYDFTDPYAYYLYEQQQQQQQHDHQHELNEEQIAQSSSHENKSNIFTESKITQEMMVSQSSIASSMTQPPSKSNTHPAKKSKSGTDVSLSATNIEIENSTNSNGLGLNITRRDNEPQQHPDKHHNQDGCDDDSSSGSVSPTSFLMQRASSNRVQK